MKTAVRRNVGAPRLRWHRGDPSETGQQVGEAQSGVRRRLPLGCRPRRPAGEAHGGPVRDRALGCSDAVDQTAERAGHPLHPGPPPGGPGQDQGPLLSGADADCPGTPGDTLHPTRKGTNRPGPADLQPFLRLPDNHRRRYSSDARRLRPAGQRTPRAARAAGQGPDGVRRHVVLQPAGQLLSPGVRSVADAHRRPCPPGAGGTCSAPPHRRRRQGFDRLGPRWYPGRAGLEHETRRVVPRYTTHWAELPLVKAA